MSDAADPTITRDAKISLGDLRAAREKMTGGDWEIVVDRNGQQNLHAFGQCPEWIALIPHQCVREIEVQQEINAVGILVTHQAADALIEIALATLELEEAREARRALGSIWSRDPRSEWESSAWDAVDQLDERVRLAVDRRRDAIGRVRR